DRMEERLRERERIARELHDTLLQSTYGLVLRFQAVADRIDRADPARHSINEALERADRIVAEGRDRVEGLRFGAEAAVDLPAVPNDPAAEAKDGHQSSYSLDVKGTPKTVQPIVRDEVFWIGRGAIPTAYHAAGGGRIGVVPAFARRELRLTVRD